MGRIKLEQKQIQKFWDFLPSVYSTGARFLKKSLMLYKRGNEILLSINCPSDTDDTIKPPKYCG